MTHSTNISSKMLISTTSGLNFTLPTSSDIISGDEFVYPFKNPTELPFKYADPSSVKTFTELTDKMCLKLSNLRIFHNAYRLNEWFMLDVQICFDFDNPFSVEYQPEVILNEYVSVDHRITHFGVIIALGCILIAVSAILLSSAIKVFRNTILITKNILLTTPETAPMKPIILDYNHCRFIDSGAMIVKNSMQTRWSWLGYLRSFRYMFYVSILSYISNILLGIYAIFDVLEDGIVGSPQFYLLSLVTLLSTADITTVFTKDTQYSLVYVLIQKYRTKLAKFLVGVMLIFGLLTLMLFLFLKDLPRFETIRDCFHIIIGLSQADSVDDLINASAGKQIGIWLLFFTLLITFLTINQILVALVTVGFQKTKDAFLLASQEKADTMARLEELTKKNYKTFDYQVRLKKELMQELKTMFRRDLPDEFSIYSHELTGVNIKKPVPESPLNRSKTFYPENLKGERLRSRSTKIHTLKRQLQSKDDNHMSYGNHPAPKNEENLAIANDEEIKVEKYISVFRNLCLELVVQIHFNFDNLQKFFDEFLAFKSKNKFSFIQIIALWDICEDYLEKLKQMEMRLLRLQNKINIM